MLLRIPCSVLGVCLDGLRWTAHLHFLQMARKEIKNTMCTESKIFWLAANEGSLFESVKNATLELKTVNFIIFDQFNQCILD